MRIKTQVQAYIQSTHTNKQKHIRSLTHRNTNIEAKQTTNIYINATIIAASQPEPHTRQLPGKVGQREAGEVKEGILEEIGRA